MAVGVQELACSSGRNNLMLKSTLIMPRGLTQGNLTLTAVRLSETDQFPHLSETPLVHTEDIRYRGVLQLFDITTYFHSLPKLAGRLNRILKLPTRRLCSKTQYTACLDSILRHQNVCSLLKYSKCFQSQPKTARHVSFIKEAIPKSIATMQATCQVLEHRCSFQ